MQRALFNIPKIAAALALLALAGCDGTIIERRGPPDSELRVALDQLNATRTRGTPILVASDTVLEFVPLGTPEKKAVDTITYAGLVLRWQVNQSATDKRCPKPGSVPQDPCSNPDYKSDYYLIFDIITLQRLQAWTTYRAEIGIREGVVDYVFARVWTESL